MADLQNQAHTYSASPIEAILQFFEKLQNEKNMLDALCRIASGFFVQTLDMTTN
jgi:hypothetical protein